jgi:choline/ethanolamine kinase
LCSPDEAKAFCLDSIDEEIAVLENEFSGECECIGFCHNDLQYGNIMIDEETKLLTVIVSSFYLAYVWFTTSVPW